MKLTLKHFLWIGLLFCSSTMGQAASYTVKPGDSLAKIARRHHCSAQELAKANDLKLNSVIHPGQSLKLPAKAKAEGNSSAAAEVPADRSHTIKAGDTLSSVSRRYKISLDALMAANPGINPNTLKVGQKIQLSGATQPKTEPEPKPVIEEPKPKPPVTPPSEPKEKIKESAPVEETKPTTSVEPTEPPAKESAPTGPQSKVRTVMVETEITFGEFAAKHGTDIQRLNELNGLDLIAATVLAKGSELYVPNQP